MILERLKEYIDYKNISVAAFERSIGMANASFGKSLKNKGAIGSDKLEKILMVYTDISSEWLLTGKGSMLKTKSTLETQNTSIRLYSKDKNSKKQGDLQEMHEKKLAFHVSEGSHEGIPLLPISAMAGAFTDDISVMEYECERYVIPAFKGADFLMQVSGDSMQPTYYSGDLVACQRIPLNDLFFQWNKTYVLDTLQGPLIKRIRRGSDEQHVLIVSDNPAYEPFELSKDQFHGVALVRGLVRIV